MNDTFQALSNEIRRQILDLVKDSPGLSVNDICTNFDMSRIAIMKHLKILEAANLLISEKVGKEKHHFFNVIPIQQIYERWTDQYSRFMASKITDFKQQIEQQLVTQEKEQSDEQQKQKSVHKIFIAAPIDKVWQQITKRDGLQAQFFNSRLDTPGLKPGAPIRMRTGKNGQYTSVVGEVLEFDPPYTYSHSFKFTSLDDPYCKVTYRLKEVDGGTEFTLINEDMPTATKTEKYMQQGASFILNTLKGVVENGRPPFKYRLMLRLMGALAFTTPKKCLSENWPFDKKQIQKED